jgi:glycerol 3-phosphatase-2
LTSTLDGAPVVCCDLDGVVWRGARPIPGSARAIDTLRQAGLRLAFVTNNSSPRIADILEKLARAGIESSEREVLTSASAAAALLTRSQPSGARVLVCGGPGVEEALLDAGFEPVGAPPAAAVVVGFHRTFDFDGLARASRAVRDGAQFVATNLDATYPVAGGMLPGAGAIAAAVATASGGRPEVAGKPEAAMVALVRERFGPTGVVAGDRPSSDGALAAALAWPFALVLSGVTTATPQPGGESIPDPPPPYVADDLAALAPQLVAGLAPGRS